jgi:NAD(P)-dependent dehydrogenase (short-subunit alcohol dehydrogenase family)
MNKVAIITGAGGGIGRSTAKIFSDNNYTCVIVDVNEKNAQQTLEFLEKKKHHIYIIADVSKPNEINQVAATTLKQCKRVDVLVNLAASNRTSFDINDNIEQRWDKTIENDLKSVFLLSERIIVEMVKTGGGSIVNIGSIAGGFLGSHSIPYSACKAGIIAITKSHARIYGIHNIRVNCIVPGIIDTSMVHDSVAQKEDNYFDVIRDSTPLKRWGTPKEIAEAIFFAASDKCAFMTGATIIIDGGATLTLGPRLDETLPFKWDKFKPNITE